MRCRPHGRYKATFKELQELASRLDRETDTVPIVALDRAVMSSTEGIHMDPHGSTDPNPKLSG